MILGQKIFFWATGRRWKLKIFLNFVDSLWRHNTFMKYSFLSDINFIWRSFRNTHNFSKWTTQFVWISSTISNFSYFKRISRGPNSENRCFWQKIFWHIFSVTDIYHITKNKDFLRPSLPKMPKTARFLQTMSLTEAVNWFWLRPTYAWIDYPKNVVCVWFELVSQVACNHGAPCSVW